MHPAVFRTSGARFRVFIATNTQVLRPLSHAGLSAVPNADMTRLSATASPFTGTVPSPTRGATAFSRTVVCVASVVCVELKCAVRKAAVSDSYHVNVGY